MSILLLVSAAVWLTACSLALSVVIPLMHASTEADEADGCALAAAQRQAALNELSELRSRSGVRFFGTAHARRELTEALAELLDIG